MSQPSPSCVQRRRRCFMAPALGRPLNSQAAPDVRAPSVRGRWHFWACFGPFYPSSGLLSGTAPWHRRGLRIYAGGMNDAIQGATENPSQAAMAPRVSVIVPTFNECDNVTTLFRRLEATLEG